MKTPAIFLAALLFFLFTCQTRNPQTAVPDDLVFEKMAYTWKDANEAGFPKISAHRGGMAYPGYPENALETMQYVFSQTGAIIECDIAMTSDNQLILLHDASLDRTTTCTGHVNRQGWNQLQDCQLEDNTGQKTPYHIPTLDQLLDWADDKGVLFTLDVKRGVPFEKVIDAVREYDYFEKAAIITYNTDDAVRVHRLAPEAYISVSIRNEEELQWIKDTRISLDRLIAFTGTRLSSPRLYQQLEELGIPAILGTLGNLDERAKTRGDRDYATYLEKGVDILATNRPLEAFAATYQSN